MILLMAWWSALLWTFSSHFSRPYDDWKNLLLYSGAGVWGFLALRSNHFFSTIRQNALFKLIIAYLGVCTISILFSRARYHGFLTLSMLVLWTTLIFTFLRLEETRLHRLMGISALSAATISLLHLSHWITIIWPKPVFMPPIGHVSYFGDFMALNIPFASFFVWKTRSLSKKVFWVAVLVSILAGLFYSGTRASLAGLILALLLVLGLSGSLRLIPPKKILLGSLVIVVILALLDLSLPKTYRDASAFRRIYNNVVENLSDRKKLVRSGRWFDLAHSLKMIKTKPILGWGPGSYRFEYPPFATSPDYHPHPSLSKMWVMHPHNELVHQTAEVGLAGLLIFLVLWAYGGWKGVRTLRSCKDKNDQALLLTGFAGLAICFGSWQFSTNFLFPLSRLLFAFYAALIIRRLIPSEETQPGDRTGTFVRSAWLVAILASLLLNLSYHASLYWLRKSDLEKSSDKKVTFSEAAYRLAPGSFDATLVHTMNLFHSRPLEESETLTKQLLESFPNVPVVLMLVAERNITVGKNDEAVVNLKRVLEIEPRFRAAEILIKRLSPQIEKDQKESTP